MLRLASWTLTTLTALTLLGCSGSSDSQDDDPGSTEPEGPATARWMADVYADRLDTQLGSVLLPGAFNSSSYACAEEHGISPDSPETVFNLWGSEAFRDKIVGWAKTQDRPLAQQLEDGIRFVEINVTLKDGVVTTWHSVYGVPLSDVLDEVVTFAVTWPKEAVVLAFGLTLDRADWGQFADELAAPRVDGVSLCDRIYDGTESAARVSFGNIRESGRNVIWSPSGELREFLEERGDCPLSRGETERAWSITVTLDGVEQTLADSVANRDPDKLLINDFVFSLDGADSGGQVEYLLAHDGVREASVALGFSGDFPERLISTHDAGGQMNIFAGAYYEDTTLIEAAIARNRE